MPENQPDAVKRGVQYTRALGFAAAVSQYPVPSSIPTPRGLARTNDDCFFTVGSDRSIYKFDQAGSVVSTITPSTTTTTGVSRGPSDDCLWVSAVGGIGPDFAYRLNQQGGGDISDDVLIAAPAGSPQGVGIDSADSIWNASASTDSIYKLDDTGSVITSFASPSSQPLGVGIDSADSIWNADRDADSIYKLDDTGSQITSFAAPSSAPEGVGIDSAESIWNADDNGSIYKLDNTGSQITSFASPGGSPRGVGIDSADSIWHADSDIFTNTIYKLDDTGSQITSFASPSVSTGLGIDSADSIWIASLDDDSIYKLDDTGSQALGPGSDAFGVNERANAVAPDDDTSLWIVTGETAAKPFDQSGNDQEVAFGSPSGSPEGVGIDSADSIWNADDMGHLIYKLDDTGSQITSFDTPTFGMQDLSNPTGVGIDSVGSIWNANGANGAIYTFDDTGSTITSFATPSSNPQGVGIDSANSIWHADSSANSIYKLDDTGSQITSFAAPAGTPTGVGIDAGDSIWHADRDADSIYKLDNTGSQITSFATPSTEPRGVGIDSVDSIWHADNGDDSIYKLRDNGEIVGGSTANAVKDMTASPLDNDGVLGITDLTSVTILRRDMPPTDEDAPTGNLTGISRNGSVFLLDTRASSVYEVQDSPDAVTFVS